MSRWPGGLIRKTAITPAGPFQDGAAPGVWTIMEAAYWVKQGLWPVAGNVNARGLFGGGGTPVGNSNIIGYITIATLGDATDVGDLTSGRNGLTACASSTRGLFAGGSSSSNIIDYVTIATTGNATSFGNLPTSQYTNSACSNSHGGL